MASKILVPRVMFRAVVRHESENKLQVRQTLDLYPDDPNAEGYDMDLVLSRAHCDYPAFETGEVYEFVCSVMATSVYKGAELRWYLMSATKV